MVKPIASRTAGLASAATQYDKIFGHTGAWPENPPNRRFIAHIRKVRAVCPHSDEHRMPDMTMLTPTLYADNNSLSPIYLLQAGEILVKQGKYDDAIQAYTTIKDKYFRSYQAMDIDKYIEQAKLLKK
jgi:hypothetical protein